MSQEKVPPLMLPGVVRRTRLGARGGLCTLQSLPDWTCTDHYSQVLSTEQQLRQYVSDLAEHKLDAVSELQFLAPQLQQNHEYCTTFIRADGLQMLHELLHCDNLNVQLKVLQVLQVLAGSPAVTQVAADSKTVETLLHLVCSPKHQGKRSSEAMDTLCLLAGCKILYNDSALQPHLDLWRSNIMPSTRKDMPPLPPWSYTTCPGLAWIAEAVAHLLDMLPKGKKGTVNSPIVKSVKRLMVTRASGHFKVADKELYLQMVGLVYGLHAKMRHAVHVLISLSILHETNLQLCLEAHFVDALAFAASCDTTGGIMGQTCAWALAYVASASLQAAAAIGTSAEAVSSVVALLHSPDPATRLGAVEAVNALLWWTGADTSNSYAQLMDNNLVPGMLHAMQAGGYAQHTEELQLALLRSFWLLRKLPQFRNELRAAGGLSMLEELASNVSTPPRTSRLCSRFLVAVLQEPTKMRTLVRGIKKQVRSQPRKHAARWRSAVGRIGQPDEEDYEKRGRTHMPCVSGAVIQDIDPPISALPAVQDPPVNSLTLAAVKVLDSTGRTREKVAKNTTKEATGKVIAAGALVKANKRGLCSDTSRMLNSWRLMQLLILRLTPPMHFRTQQLCSSPGEQTRSHDVLYAQLPGAECPVLESTELHESSSSAQPSPRRSPIRKPKSLSPSKTSLTAADRLLKISRRVKRLKCRAFGMARSPEALLLSRSDDLSSSFSSISTSHDEALIPLIACPDSCSDSFCIVRNESNTDDDYLLRSSSSSIKDDVLNAVNHDPLMSSRHSIAEVEVSQEQSMACSSSVKDTPIKFQTVVLSANCDSNEVFVEKVQAGQDAGAPTREMAGKDLLLSTSSSCKAVEPSPPEPEECNLDGKEEHGPLLESPSSIDEVFPVDRQQSMPKQQDLTVLCNNCSNELTAQVAQDSILHMAVSNTVRLGNIDQSVQHECLLVSNVYCVANQAKQDASLGDSSTNEGPVFTCNGAVRGPPVSGPHFVVTNPAEDRTAVPGPFAPSTEFAETNASGRRYLRESSSPRVNLLHGFKTQPLYGITQIHMLQQRTNASLDENPSQMTFNDSASQIAAMFAAPLCASDPGQPCGPSGPKPATLRDAVTVKYNDKLTPCNAMPQAGAAVQPPVNEACGPLLAENRAPASLSQQQLRGAFAPTSTRSRFQFTGPSSLFCTSKPQPLTANSSLLPQRSLSTNGSCGALNNDKNCLGSGAHSRHHSCTGSSHRSNKSASSSLFYHSNLQATSSPLNLQATAPPSWSPTSSPVQTCTKQLQPASMYQQDSTGCPFISSLYPRESGTFACHKMHSSPTSSCCPSSGRYKVNSPHHVHNSQNTFSNMPSKPTTEGYNNEAHGNTPAECTTTSNVSGKQSTAAYESIPSAHLDDAPAVRPSEYTTNNTSNLDVMHFMTSSSMCHSRAAAKLELSEMDSFSVTPSPPESARFSACSGSSHHDTVSTSSSLHQSTALTPPDDTQGSTCSRFSDHDSSSVPNVHHMAVLPSIHPESTTLSPPNSARYSMGSRSSHDGSVRNPSIHAQSTTPSPPDSARFSVCSSPYRPTTSPTLFNKLRLGPTAPSLSDSNRFSNSSSPSHPDSARFSSHMIFAVDRTLYQPEPSLFSPDSPPCSSSCETESSHGSPHAPHDELAYTPAKIGELSASPDGTFRGDDTENKSDQRLQLDPPAQDSKEGTHDSVELVAKRDGGGSVGIEADLVTPLQVHAGPCCLLDGKAGDHTNMQLQGRAGCFTAFDSYPLSDCSNSSTSSSRLVSVANLMEPQWPSSSHLSQTSSHEHILSSAAIQGLPESSFTSSSSGSIFALGPGQRKFIVPADQLKELTRAKQFECMAAAAPPAEATAVWLDDAKYSSSEDPYDAYVDDQTGGVENVKHGMLRRLLDLYGCGVAGVSNYEVLL